MLKQVILFAVHLSLCSQVINPLENSACIGNIQDAPLTNFKNTPLKDWSAFVLSPLNSLYGPNHKEMLEKVEALAKKELEKIGEIKEIQASDVRGLGMAANVLNLEIQNVPNLPKLLRLSLTLQTNVTINKTNQECSAYVWASSVFIEGEISAANEKPILKGAENLFQQFVNCYKASNPNKTSNPNIYFYR
jgi:hypothetical protein